MATITKRKWTTGKGEAREAWTLAFTDKTGKRHKLQFSRKRDAEAKRVEVEGQIKGGAFRDSKATVTEAITDYVAHLQERNAKGHRVATGYLRNTKGQLETYVAPHIGSVQLADLTKGEVAKLRDTLQKEGATVPLTRKVIAALSRTLRFAEERDLIASNPAKGVRVIGAQGEGQKKVYPPSRATLALIVGEADKELALRIRFASQTGLRASEMWALRWGDINWRKREVAVSRAVDIFGEVKETTKTNAGRRTVPLNDRLIADLEPRKGEPVGYVFPNTVGGFVRHTNFLKRSWGPLLDKAEAKAAEAGQEMERIGWHSLRHFAISTWVLGGINMKAVQSLAGHASFQMTADRYSHLLPDDTPHAALNRLAAEVEA